MARQEHPDDIHESARGENAERGTYQEQPAMLHSPGPWEVHHLSPEGGCSITTLPMRDGVRVTIVPKVFSGTTGALAMQEANARLIADAPDLHDQLMALTLYWWDVEKRSLYDEEGVEGWIWTEPDGTEHSAIGSWDELPPWPESARAAVRKAKRKDDAR